MDMVKNDKKAKKNGLASSRESRKEASYSTGKGGDAGLGSFVR